MSSLMHVYMEFERILSYHISIWWNYEAYQMRPKWGCHSLILGFGECHHRILRVEHSLITYFIFIFGVLSKTINRGRGVGVESIRSTEIDVNFWTGLYTAVRLIHFPKTSKQIKFARYFLILLQHNSILLDPTCITGHWTNKLLATFSRHVI